MLLLRAGALGPAHPTTTGEAGLARQDPGGASWWLPGNGALIWAEVICVDADGPYQDLVESQVSSPETCGTLSWVWGGNLVLSIHSPPFLMSWNAHLCWLLLLVTGLLVTSSKGLISQLGAMVTSSKGVISQLGAMRGHSTAETDVRDAWRLGQSCPHPQSSWVEAWGIPPDALPTLAHRLFSFGRAGSLWLCSGASVACHLPGLVSVWVLGFCASGVCYNVLKLG